MHGHHKTEFLVFMIWLVLWGPYIKLDINIISFDYCNDESWGIPPTTYHKNTLERNDSKTKHFHSYQPNSFNTYFAIFFFLFWDPNCCSLILNQSLVQCDLLKKTNKSCFFFVMCVITNRALIFNMVKHCIILSSE